MGIPMKRKITVRLIIYFVLIHKKLSYRFNYINNNTILVQSNNSFTETTP